MRILHAYIARGFMAAFGVTLVVFLFVMAIGNIFKVIDLFSRGVSGVLILKVFSYGIPFSLIFAIPMSILAAVFLHFSRLASDREIIAMKACGISLWYALRLPLLAALALSAVCVYINCNVAPDSHYARRKVLSKLGIETPLSLLDEGRFIRDFPNLTVYIGKKSGSLMKDIVIHQLGPDGGIARTIRANSGTVAISRDNPGKIQVNLYRVRIEQPDEEHPDDLARVQRLSAEEYPIEIDVQGMVNRDIVWKKRADLTMAEIAKALRRSARFVPSDFVDPAGLAARLVRPGEDSVAAWLHLRMSEAALEFLGRGAGTDMRQVARVLAAEFNQILQGQSIYSTNAFANVQLSGRTLNLMRENQDGASSTRLNRMLIEDAFPDLVIRNTFLDLDNADSPGLHTALLVEANTRLTLSLSCFAFVLLGAALGIKIHRKESSLGIAVALLLVFVFYFFIIIADSLVNRPELKPHLIVWIPFIFSMGLGCWMIQRSN